MRSLAARGFTRDDPAGWVVASRACGFSFGIFGLHPLEGIGSELAKIKGMRRIYLNNLDAVVWIS